MYRYLPAVAALTLFFGVVALATTNAFEDHPKQDPPVVSPEPQCPPLTDCPLPTGVPQELLPENYPSNPTPVPNAFVVNGIEIPIPEGAHPGIGIGDPGGGIWFYATGEYDSTLIFSPNGWISGIELRSADLEEYRPAFDALEVAADPINVGGRTLRIPWGTVYRPPMFPVPESTADAPEDALWLHLLKRGQSILTFDIDGRVVTERIAGEDADEFRPILDVLSDADS